MRINTNSTGRCVWQLPVSYSERDGDVRVKQSAKYHCFLDDRSLCGKHYQLTSDYDEGISITNLYATQHPDHVCKHCYNKWKNASPERKEKEDEDNDA